MDEYGWECTFDREGVYWWTYVDVGGGAKSRGRGCYAQYDEKSNVSARY